MRLLNDVIKDLKRDFKTARHTGLRGWGWFYLGAGALAICLSLLAIGRFDLSDSALGCYVGISSAIGVKWNLRRFTWFWVTIAIVAALHVPFILLVRLPDKLTSGPSIGPIGLIAVPDIVVVLVIVDIVGRLVKPPADGKQL